MVKINEIDGMFWGVTLEGDKRYAQTTEKPVHLSMAALDTTHPQAEGSTASVFIECKGSSYVLCTLQHGRLFQQPLDLEFAAGEHLVLYTKGKGSVHLSGYLIPENDDYDLPPDSDEELSESEALSDASEEDSDEDNDVTSKRKLMIKGGKNAKKARMTIDDLDEDDDDDSDDDDFMDSEAEEASDDEEELEEDDFDEESDDEEPQKPAGKKPKLGNGTSAKAAVVNVPVKSKAESKAKTTPASTPAASKPQNVSGGAGDAEGKKKKKKKKNKNKNDNGQNTSTSETKPDTTTSVASKSPAKRTAEGGVVVEDLKEGHGPEAKHGKMLRVHYIGRLSNGKVFDSCTGGSGFKFKLGKKEVISGWDVGIAGMKVGGKRKLTIPPKMGYGFQAAGGIPPNSTLVFDVELKAVN